MFNFSNLDKFLAHKNKVATESLKEHCERTKKYLELIKSDYYIEETLKKILKESGITDIESVIKYIYELIIYHDLGKIDKKFQEKIKNGTKESAPHSDKSFFVFIYLFVSEFKGGLLKKERGTSMVFTALFILSMSVLRHHSSLNDLLVSSSGMTEKFIENEESVKYILEQIQNDKKIDNDIISLLKEKYFWSRWSEDENNRKIIKRLNGESDELSQDGENDNLNLFFLFKLTHSILISSDIYATKEFDNEKASKRERYFYTLDKQTIDKIDSNFRYGKELQYSYDETQQKKRENFNFKIDGELREELLKKRENIESLNEINDLRSLMNLLAESSLIEKLKSRKERDNNVFFLNIPTGGGKTNISLRLALSIMKNRENIKHLYYVFPFINIIEQSYDYLRNFISDENMARLDSRSIDNLENKDDDYEESEYDERGLLKMKMDSNLFFNYPVIFSSHIMFFDLFFRNSKNSNYNFFKLINSVVIIDEIQAYSDEYWTFLSSLFSACGKLLNTHFIVMSATLPKLDILSGTNFERLFDEPLQDSISNHKLFERVKIAPSGITIKKSGAKANAEFKALIDRVKENKNHKKILIVLNTIDDSKKVFTLIEQDSSLKNSYKIVLLNSTILNSRRREIIEECKKESEKIILVSTQSVEAGVDIDFDIGYRSYAPMDNIVQVAGRINRNAKRNSDNPMLYIINDDEWQNVYRDGYRTDLSKNMRDDFFNKGIDSAESLIKEYYNKIVGNIDRDNKQKFVKSSNVYIDNAKMMDFATINKDVSLIKGDNISIFIPIDIEIKGESALLKTIEKYYSDIDLFENGKLSGEKVWSAYDYMMQNRADPFDEKVKYFQKILSNFTISLFNGYVGRDRIKNLLAFKNGVKYGYFYFNDHKNIYDEKEGLDVEKFKKHITNRAIFY